MARVMRVTEVKVQILKKNPPILVVTAKGVVPTGGWTNIKLSRVVYVNPPAGGIQGFEFIGTPPSGPVTQVLTKVSASAQIPRIPRWLKGVRVRAARNSKTVRVRI